jgi:hypothetical protein
MASITGDLINGDRNRPGASNTGSNNWLEQVWDGIIGVGMQKAMVWLEHNF